MIKRTFEAVSTGAQTFKQRFPGKRRRLDYDEDLPAHAQWRCNLTGLSSVNNLYFVAYVAQLHVYAPIFPTQSLGKPCLIVNSQPSAPHLRGYIDPYEPHCINNLIVTYLGTEEVVALVRDDGDVDVFLVRHIVQAIHRRSSTQLEPLAEEVKPMFQTNVGISAWGIAIHSQARVLAVSNNHHTVTIFSFALTQSDSHNDKRDQDVTSRVVNGDANIPDIAFCNTGDDPNARWLLTTDIKGICRVFDLHLSKEHQGFRFGRSYELGQMDRINAGWIVMFLDRRSFKRENSVRATLGLQENESLPDADPLIWDLSRTVRHLPGYSSFFIKYKQKRNLSPAERSERPRRSDTSAQLDTIQTETITETMEELPDTEYESEEDDEVLDETEDDASIGLDVPITSTYVDGEPLSDASQYFDLPEGTEDDILPSAIYGGDRICGNSPRFMRETSLCGDLPCPIFHASVRNMYLLQPTNDPLLLLRPHFIGVAGPLKQSIQIDYHELNEFDRLNMSAYCSSLGVLVVASQKGRVSVLALTKTGAHIPSSAKTIYAFRPEAILPTKTQEEANLRPFSPLHGIALGPMQGRSYYAQL